MRIIQRCFSYLSTKTYVVTPQKNRLDETVPMMGHKICINGEIWPIVPKFPLLSLFILSTDTSVGSFMDCFKFEQDGNPRICVLFSRVLTSISEYLE